MGIRQIDMSGYPYGYMPQKLYDRYGLRFAYTPYSDMNIKNWGALTIRNHWLVITLCEQHLDVAFRYDLGLLMYHEVLYVAEAAFGLEHRYNPAGLRDEMLLDSIPIVKWSVVSSKIAEINSTAMPVSWLTRTTERTTHG